jgi:hypothetical protein
MGNFIKKTKLLPLGSDFLRIQTSKKHGLRIKTNKKSLQMPRMLRKIDSLSTLLNTAITVKCPQQLGFS